MAQNHNEIFSTNRKIEHEWSVNNGGEFWLRWANFDFPGKRRDVANVFLLEMKT